MHHSARLLFCLISLISFSYHVQASVSYAIQDLQDYFGEYQNGAIEALAINDNGLIAGEYDFYTENNFISQVFVLDTKNNSLTFITPPEQYEPGEWCYFRQLNNQNQILVEIDDQPFLWDSTNGLQTIDVSQLDIGKCETLDYGLNNLGQVLLHVEQYRWLDGCEDSDDGKKGFYLWEKGKELTYIPIYELFGTEFRFDSFSINDKGQIYFTARHDLSLPHPLLGEKFPYYTFVEGYVLYENGAISYISAPRIGQYCYPLASNNHGDFLITNEDHYYFNEKRTVDVFISAEKGQQVFLYQYQQGKLPFYNDFSDAVINDAMKVICYSTLCTLESYYPSDILGRIDCKVDCEDNYLRQWTPEDGWVNLSTLIHPDFYHITEEWIEPSPEAINNHDQILLFDDNLSKSYLLTPISD